MAFPTQEDELALHERVVAGDPVAPADAYRAFMDPLVNAVMRDIRRTDDAAREIANESATEALLAYLGQAGRYDREKGRLSSYLMGIAKKKALDRIRADTAREIREKKWAELVALGRVNPKDKMEAAVEDQELWDKVAEAVPSESDRFVLTLILSGERSTEVLAEALGLTDLPLGEQRRRVKQHRDRLLKTLERLGVRLRRGGKA